MTGQLGPVILFEKRNGKFGYAVRDAVPGHLSVGRPALNGDMAQLRIDLEAILVSNGLFADEAHAMVETWRDSWFEEGARVFYIYPRKELDATLPLTILPTPEKTQRVFVGRLELITPEMEEAVLTASVHSDRATLNRYGRFLNSISERLFQDNRASEKDLSFANNLSFRLLSARPVCE